MNIHVAAARLVAEDIDVYGLNDRLIGINGVLRIAAYCDTVDDDMIREALRGAQILAEQAIEMIEDHI